MRGKQKKKKSEGETEEGGQQKEKRGIIALRMLSDPFARTTFTYGLCMSKSFFIRTKRQNVGQRGSSIEESNTVFPPKRERATVVSSCIH